MRRFFVMLLALVLSTGFVLAQGVSTGTLEGTVASEGGDPIDAVVTLSGPQGVKTATTDSQGKFLFRGLAPGKYTVKTVAAGYGTVVQNEVQVSLNSRTQLPFVLTKGLEEQVTVTSQAPLVDLRSTTTGASINVDEFAPYVPLGRNLVSIFTIAPGVADGGDPVLGSTNSSISGSSGLENAYFVDGVNITNSGYGALGAYSIVYGSLGTGVTYDFLEEVQVQTGGFEAEYGQAGGGIVNTVVKSGTNDFSFDVNWYEEPTSLEGTRGDRTDTPNIANTTDSLRRDISLSAGGPILEDKLFYFAAYNPVWLEQSFRLTSGSASQLYDLDGDGNATDSFNVGQTISGGRTPGTVTRKRSIDNYAAKFSWYATPNHRFELVAFGDPSDGDVGAQAPTGFLRNLTDPVGIPDPTTGATGLDWGGDQISIKYQGVWTSNFFTDVQISQKENSFSEIGPGVSFRSFFDVDANNTFGGAGFYEELIDETDQISFKNTHVIGPVEFSYGYQSEEIEWAQPRLRSGPTYMSYFPNLVVDGGGLSGFVAGCADPTFDAMGNPNDANCYTGLQSTTGASVSAFGLGSAATDVYQVTRTVFTQVGDPTTATEDNLFAQATWDVVPTVTIKAGLRWTEQELQGAGNETLPIGTLSTGEAVGGLSTNLTGQSYTFDAEIAPRLGVTWDVKGDGRHKLYANWGEYYQRVPSDLAVRAFSNEVGTTDEEFLNSALTIPNLNGNCGFDSNSDGTFDTTVACHQAQTVNGLAGGGSIILDGSQKNPSSVPGSALGSLAQLTTSAATKMPFTEEILGGYAFEINDYTGIEFRYIHRELGRVLEDIQFASNEQTWNLFWGASGNPNTVGDPFVGHGSGAFGAYVFANVGGNVNTTLFPNPERNYDALEVIFNRRFNNGWMAYANYRFAELDGNYEGSFRNDNGQSDPFLTSLFDFPAASAVDTNSDGSFDTFIPSDTLAGQYNSGPLNTERRHIFNGFVSKQLDMGMNIGGRLNIQSGQPRGPLFAHPAYQNAGEIPGFNPVFWWGVDLDTTSDGLADTTGFFTSSNGQATAPVGTMLDSDGDGNPDGVVIDHNGELAGNAGDGFATGPRLFSYDVVDRDFFGRNATQVTFDFHVGYDIELREGSSKLTLLLDIFNVFDDNDATRFDNNVETRPGFANPDFLKPNLFQGPRNIRLGAKFTW